MVKLSFFLVLVASAAFAQSSFKQCTKITSKLFQQECPIDCNSVGANCKMAIVSVPDPGINWCGSCAMTDHPHGGEGGNDTKLAEKFLTNEKVTIGQKEITQTCLKEPNGTVMGYAEWRATLLYCGEYQNITPDSEQIKRKVEFFIKQNQIGDPSKLEAVNKVIKKYEAKMSCSGNVKATFTADDHSQGQFVHTPSVDAARCLAHVMTGKVKSAESCKELQSKDDYNATLLSKEVQNGLAKVEQTEKEFQESLKKQASGNGDNLIFCGRTYRDPDGGPTQTADIGAEITIPLETKFDDNSATVSNPQSIIDSIVNSDKFKAMKGCKPEITSIEIDASSSKLRNTKGTDSWDFAGLSKKRAEAIKSVIANVPLNGLQSALQDPKKLTFKLGDNETGASGPCPYFLDPIPGSENQFSLVQLLKDGVAAKRILSEQVKKTRAELSQQVKDSQYTYLKVRFKSGDYCSLIDDGKGSVAIKTDKCMKLKLSCAR